jgi:hypothetical protein
MVNNVLYSGRMRGWLVLLPAVVTACSDAPPACAPAETECAPLYAPTWDNVYTQTVARSCGGNRSSCHAAGGDGEIDLSTPETAYGSLVPAHVTAGDASCSDLVVRVHGDGEDYLMPPGAPLRDSERCAIAQWVQAGAVE